MWRWASVCLFSLLPGGCGDDACVRQSDCRLGLHCAAGRCIAPDGAAPLDAGADDAVPWDALEEPASDGADDGPADGATNDSNPADAQPDVASDGGTDA